MKNYFSTKRIAFLAVFTSMVMLTTLVLRIPGPLGYVNIGDAVIFMAAALFDPIFALIAGGIGSTLADLIGGYAVYAIPTLVIKSVEGLVAGLIILAFKKIKFNKLASLIVGMTAGACIMAGGYFCANCFLYSPGAAVGSLPFDLTQAGISLLLGVVVSFALLKIRAVNDFIAFADSDKIKEVKDEKDSGNK